MKASFFTILFTLILPGLITAGDKVIVSDWLSTGPFEIHMPVFHNTPDVRGNTFSNRQLLTFNHMELDDYFPEQGKEVRWLNGRPAAWSRITADQEGFVKLDQDNNKIEVTYLAAYIKTDRYISGQLELRSPYMLEGWLNGQKIGTKSTIERNDGDEQRMGAVSHQVKLQTGTHLLMLKVLKPAGEETPLKVSGQITLQDPFYAGNIINTTSPETIKNILHFMDGIKVTNVQPSPDGSMVAISYRQSLPPSDRSESWTDIKRTRDNSLVHSFRHTNVSRIGWLPNSNSVSYTTVQDGKTTIYCHHMETGRKIVLTEGIENFSGMRWSPTEAFIIYWVSERGEGANATMRHILGMQDRQNHYRTRTFLYKLDLHSGVRTRLTFGSLSTSLQDISPDGRFLVFSQSRPDYLQRPFTKQDLFLLEIDNLALDTLLAGQRWGVSVQFSPDGKSLLATGGPSAFNRTGENIPDGMIANNYDTQAYIFSLADRSVRPFTIDFDPSIVSVHWHSEDGHIYILAGDEDYRRLFRYNVRRETFERIATDTDFITSMQFASNSRMAAYIGNKVNAPQRAYTLNLRNDRFEVLEDPDAARYRHVVFGHVNEWDFTASTGVNIKGRYYLPPDFDPEKKYPVIVYQYGGTNPVGRTFGGRYPFNLWAGNGYVVYVLQPSGATGFGQAFSAAHVNNWGKTVADEIIEATQGFLETHTFADRARVGVAGASYGGFMTMLLLTQTDLFATGISHAGISNITSYWGEGFWGYGYSAEASARSYPWDSPDLYVGQSPVFMADKINSPLLLITGDSDTNVPPGESIQMYTALTLLDRPVELVLVEGEDHHIVTYSKRLKWHDAIMAWWDKYLKDQPEWWEEQYPKHNY